MKISPSGYAAVLAGKGELREVRMFGGLCFRSDGNMVGGISKHGLLIRVGREQHGPSLARPIETSGRPVEGDIVIYPPPKEYRILREWLDSASHSLDSARKVAGIEGAGGQGGVTSGAERDNHIEQDARAAQAPQHEGGNAQQEGDGPCDP
jgi:TfoX N-terminal domain